MCNKQKESRAVRGRGYYLLKKFRGHYSFVYAQLRDLKRDFAALLRDKGLVYTVLSLSLRWRLLAVLPARVSIA